MHARKVTRKGVHLKMNFFAPAFPSYERACPEFGLAKNKRCFSLGLAHVESAFLILQNK